MAEVYDVVQAGQQGPAQLATTTLPHVIEPLCGADPRSPEFVTHYADQVAALTELLTSAQAE
ncbi:hypothetical protein ACPPVO_53245 [Dactylosporangium sp. McL0621]|uniref:hypothetical protein n=1 Tax=Dactylosporangium sp. McL0621 TaxID=3415678 RepID=UPI003CEB8CA9